MQWKQKLHLDSHTAHQVITYVSKDIVLATIVI